MQPNYLVELNIKARSPSFGPEQLLWFFLFTSRVYGDRSVLRRRKTQPNVDFHDTPDGRSRNVSQTGRNWLEAGPGPISRSRDDKTPQNSGKIMGFQLEVFVSRVFKNVHASRVKARVHNYGFKSEISFMKIINVYR